MEEKLKFLESEYKSEISQVKTLEDLDKIFLELFGKSGKITIIAKQLPEVEPSRLKVLGPIFNKTKQSLEDLIEEKRRQVKIKSYEKLHSEKLTLEETNEIKKRQGRSHLMTRFETEILELFEKLGFQRYDAPHIESDYYNFEVLNMPSEHPARDLWDTLYIESKKKDSSRGEMLLRTHTSNAQIRVMEQHKPPFRIMIMDRCFRYENLDARHEHTLDQFELVYIDKDVSMANLQYLSEYFLKNILGQDIKARLRPKYYPFVEPGAGVDGLCIFCRGKGCKICGGVGWLELAGAGMIHPSVLKNGGIDPETYTGIAWGFGPERMAMLKYGITDIRSFKSGDLNFLAKF